MASKVYDIYDLQSPFVAATAPAPQAAPTATRRGGDRLMRGSAYLLTFAGALILAAFILTASPLARWDVDLTVPFVAVLVCGLAAIAWAVRR